MGDLTNRVTTLYRADTSQAKAAVAGLRGAERERAKAVLDGLTAENAALEASLAKWAKIGIAVGVAVGAYALLRKAHHAYLEDVRLESSAAGVNVDRLKAATRGLVEEDKLLAFAGKAQAGVWKLNEQEMQRVLKGAMALRKTMGVELEPTVDALTEAITKGSTRALKEFGIEAKDKEGALRELDKVVEKLGGNFEMAGDDIAAAGVKASDAMDDLMGSLGRLVVALGPAIEGLAELVDLAAKALGERGGFSASTQGNTETLKSMIVNAEDAFERTGDASYRAIADNLWKDYYAALAKQVEQASANAFKELDARTDKYIADAFALRDRVEADFQRNLRAKKSGRGGGGGVTTTADRYGSIGGGFGAEFTGLGGAGIGPGGIEGVDQGGFLMAQRDERLAAEDSAAKLLAAQKEAEKHGKFLESIFGPVDQFNVYAEGFNLLTGAATSAFDAWITGSESMGVAVKKAIGEGLRGVASQMLVESLKHAAFALGSLAFLDFRGAATHGAAAAAFAGGAVAAGLAARELGAGAGGARASASAGGAGAAVGGAYSGSGGAGGGGNQSTVVYITDAANWDDRTPTQRKQSLARAVREGGVTRTNNIVIHQ